MPPRHVRLAVGYASLLPPALRAALVRAACAPCPASRATRPILDFEHPADTMIRWRGFTRPEIEALCGEPVSFAHTQFYRTFARFPRSAHFERYSALLNAMPCDRLNQATLISGAARCATRSATRETDRFIRQLRTDCRYLPGQPKRILRALLARYVPREIWDVPKHGFNFPLQRVPGWRRLRAGARAIWTRPLAATRAAVGRRGAALRAAVHGRRPAPDVPRLGAGGAGRVAGEARRTALTDASMQHAQSRHSRPSAPRAS